MALSMYDASVPVFVRVLRNLDQVLAKGEAHARDKGAQADALLQSRLIFDMLPLVRQVQIATDMATRGASRLAGAEPRSVEDNETSFEQLHARIAAAIEHLDGFTPAQFDGSQTRASGERLVNLMLWFDNEWAFSRRLLDVAAFWAKRLGRSRLAAWRW